MKYVLAENTQTHKSLALYQIMSLITFGQGLYKVNAGDLGGWVQSETNLSQEGECWIYQDPRKIKLARQAKVHGNAYISGNAKILHRSKISGNAQISGNAVIGSSEGRVKIYGDARVFGDARVYENASIHTKAQVYGNSRLHGDASIGGNLEFGQEGRELDIYTQEQVQAYALQFYAL